MFKNLSKPQAETLAAFSFGIAKAKSCENLARSVIRAPPRKKPVIVLVDETGLKDRLKAMAVSIAYEGRAVPAAFWTYPQTQWPMG